jgi:hypothetical protein
MFFTCIQAASKLLPTPENQFPAALQYTILDKSNNQPDQNHFQCCKHAMKQIIDKNTTIKTTLGLIQQGCSIPCAAAAILSPKNRTMQYVK